MKKKTRGILILVLAGTMLLLAGCKKGMTQEEASAYVKSVLDASYKGEFKEYAEQTGSTEKEAEEVYNGSVENLMQESGINDLGLSEELTSKYRQLYTDLLKAAKYEVQEAKENEDDDFDVEVKACPFPDFADTIDTVMAELQAEVSQMEDVPSTEAFNEMFYLKLHDRMNEAVKNPQYGKEQTVTLHVRKDSDGVYYIPDEELTDLDEILYPE